MSEMFRCPTCKEVIRTCQPVCQYCDSQIDERAAHAGSLNFQAGIDACAAANQIKSLTYGAPVLLLIDLALPFFVSSDDFFLSSRTPMYASVLPFGALAGAFGWLTKYGGLRTDDPDFPEAKQAVKKALILWVILSVIHIVVLAKTF
jgi:hypothetical protein